MKNSQRRVNHLYGLSILSSIFYPAITYAARCDVSAWKYCPVLEGTIDSFEDFGIKSTQALLGILGTVALILLTVAGIMYMTAAGNEMRIAAAKRIITGTIIGTGIALIAYSLLVTLADIMGAK